MLHYTSLESIASDQHSSLLGPLIAYVKIIVANMTLGANVVKLFCP